MTGVYSYAATVWFSGNAVGIRSRFSWPYMCTARMNWRRLLLHATRRALSFVLTSVGSSSAARIAIMAITTSSSINVNEWKRRLFGSLSKKPPGEGTRPAIHLDSRENPAGRVRSHGQRDVFERAVKRKTGGRVVIRSVRHCPIATTAAISPSERAFVKCAFGRTQDLRLHCFPYKHAWSC